MVRIYVAAPFQEYQLVREVQNALRGWGHEITQDWTQGAEGKPREQESAMSPGDKWLAAWRNKRGVRTADALVLLASEKHKGTGVWVELGMALAYDIPVAVMGPMAMDRTIFLHLGAEHCANLVELRAVLSSLEPVSEDEGA